MSDAAERLGARRGAAVDCGMRAFPWSDLLVPALVGGLAALVAGLATAQAASAPVGAAVAAGVWLAVLGWAVRRPLAVARAAAGELDAAQRRWLAEHVPVYQAATRGAAGLDAQRFEADVRWALGALRYEAADGAEATPELRLAVAAGAATLVHGRPGWRLPTARTVLFVPAAFDEAYGDDEPPAFDGMVHSQGPVVFSARAVARGWARTDGGNVVLHELAHLLDFEGDSDADGIPSMLDPRSADAWDELVRREMRRAERGDGILRAYAATNPAELFAVSTEVFFERPAHLRAHHPELYAALRAVYGYDPPDVRIGQRRGSMMARRWDMAGEGGTGERP